MSFQSQDFLELRYREMVGRFGKSPSTRLCNYILLETEDYYVTPSLGSITSNWVLVWPRSSFLNCRAWLGSNEEIHDLSKQVHSKLAPRNSDDYVWFEHGSQNIGSIVGCGIDFAHLHLLIDPQFSFKKFQNTVRNSNKIEWETLDAPRTSGVNLETEYHIFGNSSQGFLAEESTNLGSQFFRRVISRITNNEDCWDYRSHSFNGNIKNTISNLTV